MWIASCGRFCAQPAQQGERVGVQERLAVVVEQDLLERGQLLEDGDHLRQRERAGAVRRIARIGAELGHRAGGAFQVAVRRRLELQHARQMALDGVERRRAVDPQRTVAGDRRTPAIRPRLELPLADLAEHRPGENLAERLLADIAVDPEAHRVGARTDDVAVGEHADLFEDRLADERSAGVARLRGGPAAGSSPA